MPKHAKLFEMDAEVFSQRWRVHNELPDAKATWQGFLSAIWDAFTDDSKLGTENLKRLSNGVNDGDNWTIDKQTKEPIGYPDPIKEAWSDEHIHTFLSTRAYTKAKSIHNRMLRHAKKIKDETKVDVSDQVPKLPKGHGNRSATKATSSALWEIFTS